MKDITPNLGTEIKGIQLTELGPEGKQQLALFVAQKKVVGECPSCERVVLEIPHVRSEADSIMHQSLPEPNICQPPAQKPA